MVEPKPGAPSARLGDRIAELDAVRFVGRRDVLDPVAAALAGDEGAVLFVHAPGGMGKSALLRAIARLAAQHGRPVWALDGRLLLPSVEALNAAVAGARDAERPVVLVDSFEQIEALARTLRDQVLPGLPACSLVVLAGRRAPQPLWLRDGWEHVVREIALRALDDEEAADLLAHYGVTGEQSRLTRIWGQGSPLALHVGASFEPGRAVEDGADGDGLARAIADRLLGEEATDVDPTVMAVAAIARAVDGRLLASVLPRRTARASLEALQALTVVEAYGSRVTLHDVVRAALRADLRRTDPGLYRELTVAIADHLHDRIVGGESRLLDELADLLQLPHMRWSVGAGFGGRFRVDRPVAGDVDLAAGILGVRDTSWWPGVARWFRDAPAWVTVVRDRDGSMAGFSIAVTPRNAPPWVDTDHVLGPWVAHARQHHPDGDVVIWRDSYDLLAVRSGEPTAEVNAILNLPSHLNDELPHIRMLYGVVEADDRLRAEISARVGARHLPELDVQDGERRLQVHALDQGPGGLVGALRALVHDEQGLPLAKAVSRVSGVAVRDALRRFHDSAALAASPLAGGTTGRDRAESVRARLTDGLDRAFGPADSADRALLERAYFDPAGGHRRAMVEALMSRTTYYRRLGMAVDRLVAALDAA